MWSGRQPFRNLVSNLAYRKNTRLNRRLRADFTREHGTASVAASPKD